MKKLLKQKQKGVTLPLVIVTVVLVVAMTGIISLILQTSTAQTLRTYNFLNAKYVAVSGSQLALGAYFEGDGTSPLYLTFKERADKLMTNAAPVIATHRFENGEAEITMTGEFKGTNPEPNEYYVTVKSRAKVANSNDYYVHTVVFNLHTSGIRSETGGIEAPPTSSTTP